MKHILILTLPDFNFVAGILRASLEHHFSGSNVSQVEIESYTLERAKADVDKLDMICVLSGAGDWELPLIKKIRYFREIPVLVIFNELPSTSVIRDWVNEGHVGILTFKSAFQSIMDGLEVLGHKSYYICEHTLQLLMSSVLIREHDNTWNLTSVEANILELARKGYDITKTAGELRLSKNTVAAYRSRILTKTGSRSILELVARRSGLQE